MEGTARITVSGFMPSAQTSQIVATGSGSINVEESIAGEATNTLVSYALNISAAKMFLMIANGALTIKTNNSGAPQETINLVANKPLLWIPGVDGFAAPFADDVTALYATNAAATAVTLKIYTLLDVTE